MERTINNMNDAYDGFVNATAGFLESCAASNGLRTQESDAAIQGFKDKFEHLKASCDRAEAAIHYARSAMISNFAGAAVHYDIHNVEEFPSTDHQPSNALDLTLVPAVAVDSTSCPAVAVDSTPCHAVAVDSTPCHAVAVDSTPVPAVAVDSTPVPDVPAVANLTPVPATADSSPSSPHSFGIPASADAAE